MNYSDNSFESQEFIRHLEEATETVRSWPKWKQGIWGPALPEERLEANLSKQKCKN